jgi:hypothetical protein
MWGGARYEEGNGGKINYDMPSAVKNDASQRLAGLWPE